MCVEAVRKLRQLWQGEGGERKRWLVGQKSTSCQLHHRDHLRPFALPRDTPIIIIDIHPPRGIYIIRIIQVFIFTINRHYSIVYAPFYVARYIKLTSAYLTLAIEANLWRPSNHSACSMQHAA